MDELNVNSGPSLELLTDEAIIDFTSDTTGRQRVLSDHRDANMKYKPFRPWINGPYDLEIFGSPYIDQCLCGKVHQVSDQPCPVCGSRVYPVEEALRRFARIELPFYYLNDLRFEIFQEFFNDVFKNTKITLNFANPDLRVGGYSSTRSSRKLGIKVFDSCQFDYLPKMKELVISEFITDEAKCSYEGLLKILEENFPDRVSDLKRLINKLYLVQPAVMRPFTIKFQGGKRVLVSSKMSIWYSTIIRLCCVQDKAANELNYNEVLSKFNTPGERVRYTALLRALLNVGKKEATELLNTSKENLSRILYSVRTQNSARCPIVPSTTLKIDEVGVPFHIAYEMCRSGFVKHLMKELNFTEKEALRSTKEEYDNPEIRKLFKEYAEKQLVILNRQPSLHEYSLYAMKLRLNESQEELRNDKKEEGLSEDTAPRENLYGIELPISICNPFNADFDGDTMAIHLVPDDDAIKEETYARMSPRYVNVYKKNDSPIFTPDHEALNGLALSSEVVCENPEELNDPKEYFTSYADVLKAVEVDKTLDYRKPIVFTGKVGSEEYKNKITTAGRLRLSKILDADIDKIQDLSGKPILKWPDRISAGSGAKIYQWTYDQPDGVEKMNALQKFGLHVVTVLGNVSFDFTTLYVDTSSETYNEIRKIVDNPDLTDQQKLLMVDKKYKDYCKEIQGRFDPDLKDELKRANRVKLASIADINTPQLIISGVDEKVVVNHDSLYSGLSENEYRYHAIENRSLQSIKQMGVPSSGYLTRQLSFLTNNYKYESGEDPDNKCILIPKYRAAGRVAPDGKRYPIRELKVDEKDLVPVRSIVTKFSKPDIVTPDCISTKFKDFTPGSAIGISFGTSLTEAITQSALGLKHGGHERVLVQDGILYAPKAVKNIREEGKFMILECNSGGDLKYPRPENLVLTPDKSFKGGDIIGTAYNTSSPISKLNSLIKLLRATGNRGKRYFEKDDIIVSECYAYESGVITYKEDKSGDIVVEIGGIRYTYNPQCMYYYPEGTKIEKYQRFCSGVADMGRVVSRLGNNLQDIYIIFRNQFYTLVDGDFVKEGLNPHSTQEELCEMLFISLLNVEYDPDDDKIQGIQYLGTNSGIMNNNSFYTMLSYGYSSRVVSKALRGEAVLKDDIMTDTVLGMLIHNKLDE